ncbi:MAG: nitrous oxide-stimulated promoter family protein, partial [Desulforhopalus sp.]
FQQDKPTCGNCTIHCYKQDMRDKVRKVMRYSGPKMIRFHPLLAFFHLLDSRKKQKNPNTCDRADKHRDTRHQQQ